MAQLKFHKWKDFLPHAFFWLIVLTFPFFLHPDILTTESFDGLAVAFFIGRFSLWVALFYLNAYFLISRFVYQKKYLLYLFIQLLLVGVLFLFHNLFVSFFSVHQSHRFNDAFLLTVFPYIFVIWTSSTVYQTLRNKIAMDKIAREKEKENLRTELSFLRSQVSPHFMFNVLNNIVSLARKKSDLIEPSLIKFASLLRYMIYETGEEKKPLQNEIEYLQNYIDLQQQRFGNTLQINTSFQKENIDYLIEPMLLIPFVENAFKHSIVWDKDASIDIYLTVTDGVLHFAVKNKYELTDTGSKDSAKGIGLQNVKRRLHLLYENQHALNIDRSDGWFTVYLQLNLIA